jgi:hypothetical protein
MPLPPKTSPPKIPTDRIFLSAHAMSTAVGCHRHTLLRAMARQEISPDAYLDMNGSLQPIFLAAAAIQLARSIASKHSPHHIPEILA